MRLLSYTVLHEPPSSSIRIHNTASNHKHPVVARIGSISLKILFVSIAVAAVRKA
jgi:hypothetical protein